MKMQQEFTVAEPVSAVWKFFDEPESVAGCLPGVEHVTVLDKDNVEVRATQSLGPMTATFEAKVTVLERVTDELIRFRATGRSVRGAVGNLRTENTVRLRSTAEGTSVLVDGDLVLAGALGSVGQKVVSRQAGKVTAEFAANLQRALNGEPPAPAGPATGRQGILRAAMGGHGRAAPLPGSPPDGQAAPAARSGDPWAKAAVALSGASVVLSVVIMIRQRRGQ
jgi:carbon monoxide dehydrogenase subunit G